MPSFSLCSRGPCNVASSLTIHGYHYSSRMDPCTPLHRVIKFSVTLETSLLTLASSGLKKKRSKTDLFDGFEDRGADLFESEKVEKTLWTSDEVVEEVRTYDSEADKSFDDLLDSMVPRLGRNPRVPKPLRKGALINLIELAHTKEHLALVVKALAMYRESRTLATVVEETNAADAFIGA